MGSVAAKMSILAHEKTKKQNLAGIFIHEVLTTGPAPSRVRSDVRSLRATAV